MLILERRACGRRFQPFFYLWYGFYLLRHLFSA